MWPLDSSLGWWPKDPPCLGGDWWGVWSSDTTWLRQSGGKKRDQRQKCVNTSQMKILMPLPHPVTEPHHAQLCSPRPRYPTAVRWHSRAVVVEGKPQERAGRRREWSWDSAAASTNLDSSQTLPKELYHKPFTKMWLELETSSLYITDPDKKQWVKMSALFQTVVKSWGYVYIKERERRKKISSITFEIFGADLLQ